MKTNKNILLTGAAGTGKSKILKDYIQWAKDNKINVGVTASTGIAALNINGVTIHSLLGTGGCRNIDQYKKYVKNLKVEVKEHKYLSIASYDCLIIDEISMINAEMIELIDYILKIANESDYPFGGAKMIFAGDFMQLPPVGRESKDRKQAFRSKVWKEAKIGVYNLQKVYRQEDNEFSKVLSNIRYGDRRKYINDYFDDIQLRGDEYLEDYSDYVMLCATNQKVEQINRDHLELHDGPEHVFMSNQEGDQHYIKIILRDNLIEEYLSLKPGMIIMFTTNDKLGNFANGTTGIIKRIEKSSIDVFVDGKGLVTVERTLWKYKDGSGEVKASVSQLPVRLAHAMTIHKSQGLTLEKVIIDCEDIFENGQLYTALSRCSSKENLLLNGFDVLKQNKVDRWSVRFYNDIEGIDEYILADIEEESMYGYADYKRDRKIKIIN